MRAQAGGWRSARSRYAAAVQGWGPQGGAASAPALTGQPVAGATAIPMGAPVEFPRAEARLKFPWHGVDFSLGYLAFLSYVFVVVSYAVNLGQAAMLTAMVGITLGKNDKWRLPAPMFLLILFLIICGIGYRATPFSPDGTKPIEDIVKVVLIAIVAQSALSNRPRIRFFMFFYLAVFALWPVRGGIMNWFVYRAATQGRVAWNYAFSNPNDYAALLILPLGLCIALLWTERLKLIKQAALLGIASIPMLIFMTQSRGAILALGFGLLLYLLVQGRGRLKAILAIGAVAVVVGVFAPSGVWDRLGSLKAATTEGDLKDANDNRSAEQRFEIWKVAWAVHQEYPVLGVGWGAYPFAHSFYSRRAEFKRLAGGPRDAHNTYLTTLASTGWMGFFLWMSAIATVVTAAIRAMARVKPYAPEYAFQIKIVLLALASYGAAGVFGSFEGITFTYVHLALLIALSRVSMEEVDAYERSIGPRRGPFRGA